MFINSQFMRDQFTGNLDEENFKQNNLVRNSYICDTVDDSNEEMIEIKEMNIIVTNVKRSLHFGIT